jgi:prepilin-type N-terminal cleavage/methylation domain-containing protein
MRTVARLLRRGEAGFTLTEAMVALTIIGILMAAAIPNVARYSANQRVRSAASEMETVMRRARSIAVTRNALVTVSVNRATGTYLLREDTDRDGATDVQLGPFSLAKHVTVESVSFGGVPAVQFDGQGVPDNSGSVRLLGTRGIGYEVRIAAGSGAVTVVSHQAQQIDGQ